MQLTIMEIGNEREWSGKFGAVVSLPLKVTKPDGVVIVGELNRKPSSPDPGYAVGQTVDLEVGDAREFGGEMIHRLKRPYNGPAGGGSSGGGGGGGGGGTKASTALTEAEARSFLVSNAVNIFSALQIGLDEMPPPAILETARAMAISMFIALKDGTVVKNAAPPAPGYVEAGATKPNSTLFDEVAATTTSSVPF